MAWAVADLGTEEQAKAALDKPMLALQAIPVVPSVCRWTEVGQTTSTDRTLSTNPARRGYDGFHHYVTKPDTTSSNEWYYVFDFGDSQLIEFDGILLSGHNFGTLSLTDVTFEIDDAGTFATATEIADFGSPSDDNRLASLSLGHGGDAAPNRYSSVRYARLKLGNGGGAPFTPELGEVLLIRRRQLEFLPNVPFDDIALTWGESSATTESGVDHVTRRFSNKFSLAGQLSIDTAAYASDLESFIKACRGQFVWIYQPSTAPAAWHLMRITGEALPLPRVAGGNVRDVEITAIEQGPESFHLASET